MSLPPNLKAKYLARFDELIAEGEELLALGNISDSARGGFTASAMADDGSAVSDESRAEVLQINSRTLLATVIPPQNPSMKMLETSIGYNPNQFGVQALQNLLIANRSDFERGFFDCVFLKIESEISSDYLGQAERLLNEGSSGQYEYVPAAVLAGAVLERGLRTLCENQTPQIPTVKPNGQPITMNPMIDELKRARLFNELRAKELRSWADIRNAAAHGEFKKFNREQVERMLAGITTFLAEIL